MITTPPFSTTPIPHHPHPGFKPLWSWGYRHKAHDPVSFVWKKEKGCRRLKGKREEGGGRKIRLKSGGTGNVGHGRPSRCLGKGALPLMVLILQTHPCKGRR